MYFNWYCIYFIEIAVGTKEAIDEMLNESGQGSSLSTSVDDFGESQMDEDNSCQSSGFDPASPSIHFSDDDGDSEVSSEDLN